MATIQKLGLLGIRSFSPHDLETMEFETPLTVITGHNGAGKTTIVESLKFACTGELPPNANRGHNFIHDPDLAQMNQVKAQIRLVFSGHGGHAFSIHRNMHLMQSVDKHGKLKTTFKQLEAAIAVKKADDSRHQITSRCVDIDDQIPGLMGIPKAILENVVFVHQEDSYWPLGDMAKLKKKFDDLFGATQYTKAVTQLLVQKKNMQRMVKDALHDVKLNGELYQQTQLLDSKLKDAESKKITMTEEQASYRQEIASLHTTVQALEEQRNYAANARKDIQTREESVIANEKELKELQLSFGNDFSLMKDSLLDLQNAGKTLSDKRAELKELQQKTSEEHRKLDSELDSSLKERERFTKQFESVGLYKGRLDDTKARLHDLCGKYRVTFDGESDYEQLTAQVRSAIEQMKKETADKLHSDDQGLAARCKEMEERITTIQSDKDRITSNIAAMGHRDERSKTLKAKLSEGDVKLKAFIKEMTEVNNALASMDASTTTKPDPPVVRRSELDAMIQELSALERENSTLGINVERYAQMKAVQGQMIECKNAWQSVSKNVQDKISEITLLNDQPELKNAISLQLSKGPSGSSAVLALLRKFSGEKSQQHYGLLAKENATKEKQASLEGDIARLRLKLAEIEGQCACDIDTLRDVMPDIDILDESEMMSKFEDYIQTERQSLESKKKNLLVAQNADTMYNNFLQSSINKNSCAFCARAFEGNDVAHMKEHLSARITSLPKAVDKCQTAFTESNKQFIETENLRASVYSLRDRVTLKSQIKRDLESHTNELSSLNVEQPTASSAGIDTLTNLVEIAEELVATASRGVNFNHTLRSLLTQFGPTFDPKKGEEYISSRNALVEKLHHKRDEQERLNATVSSAERLLAAHREAEDARRQQRDGLGRRANVLDTKCKAIQEMMQESNAELVELQSIDDIDSDGLRRDVGDLEQQLSGLHGELSKIRSDKYLLGSKHEAIMQQLATELNTIDSMITTIVECQAILDSQKDAKKKLEELMNRHAHLTNVKEQQRASLDETNSKLDSVNALLTNVQNNIAFQRCYNRLNQSKQMLDQSKASMDIDKVASILEAHKKACANLTEAQSALASSEGELKAMELYLSQFLSERNQDKYNKVYERYIDARVEHRLRTDMLGDIGNYVAALDKALMQFHSKKLTEINSITKELWRIMYKGSDIEYIAIRSDTDSENKSTGVRSYNYRVVMSIRGVEIDMRGRCSAGQKVLVCIIIRLALAECFCDTCGLLTLDEPTTNLDRANIIGLGSALGSLISHRKHTSHFQLIIITHDETFVEQLAKYQVTDKVLNVYKDVEGKSRVRKLTLT